MATIANQYDPNNPNASQNTGGGGQVLSSAASGPVSTGTSPSPGGTPSGTPNVQQYLNANQGAGQQLTQGITQNVQNQANQVNQGVTNAQNQLNKQYQPLQQNLGQGQQVANTAFQDPQKLMDAYNAAKTQSSSQPLSADQQASNNQYNQFQKLNTGGYNQDISAYGNAAQQQSGQLQNQLQQFNQNVPGAVTEQNQFQLLQNAVNNPNYNQGQQTLDALFLQGQPGGARQLQQNIGQIKQQTGQNAANAQTDVNSKMQALQGLSAQDQAYIQNLFTQGNPNVQGAGLNQIGSNVGNEYNQAQQNAQNVQAGLAQSFQNGQFTPDQLKQLGVAPGTQTWGLSNQAIQNAGQYSANPLAAANQGGNAQVATPEEFARYNALNQLAGGPAGTSQASIFGTATQAGGYNPVSFNPQALQTAINTRRNAVMGDFAPSLPGGDNGSLQPYINQMSQGTPEQAQQIYQQLIGMQQNRGGSAPGLGGVGSSYQAPSSDVVNYIKNALGGFENYYNKEYQPSSAATLGGPPTTAGLAPGQEGAF